MDYQMIDYRKFIVVQLPWHLNFQQLTFVYHVGISTHTHPQWSTGLVF